jgi:hypothetical protein
VTIVPRIYPRFDICKMPHFSDYKIIFLRNFQVENEILSEEVKKKKKKWRFEKFPDLLALILIFNLIYSFISISKYLHRAFKFLQITDQKI